MNAQGAESDMTPQSLHSLLDGIARFDGADDVSVDHITLDSRKVSKGGVFFAMPGSAGDGRKHIASAIQSGASAIVYESSDGQLFEDEHIPCVGVDNLRQRVGHVAHQFYGKPSSQLHVIGITGTNGKSTCAILTAQALESLGKKCAVVGTLGSGYFNRLESQGLTTPDAVSLHQQFASFVESKAQFVCLEVSSHALDQSRTNGVRFTSVVFTNLSSDHMDYHLTRQHYRDSKAKLFVDTSADNAVLNIDDDFGRSMLNRTRAQNAISYGSGASDVRLIEYQASRTGLKLVIEIEGEKLQVQNEILGMFNALNITAVAAVLYALGTSLADIKCALNELTPVEGRMQRIQGGDNRPDVVIDYAHTPHGLECALSSLRQIKYENVICVFGCGGDRDIGKRPLMGQIAEKLANRVILTDDNPRSEAPASITDSIASGMLRSPQVIHNRREAIRTAICESGARDIVLIAGKGHENYQIYGSQTLVFSDQAVVCETLGSSE